MAEEKLSDLGFSVTKSEPVEVDITNLFSGLPAEMKPRKMKVDKTEKCYIVQLGDEKEDKIG